MFEIIIYDFFNFLGLIFFVYFKVDLYIRELVVFGYEVKGFGIDDVVIYVFDE